MCPRPATFGETLYQDTGGDWRNGEWGDEIGKVTLTHSRPGEQGITVRVSFEFRDGDTVEFSGLVPGNGTWRGRGRLRFERGRGKFADRGGELDVDSTNPKRWA